MQEIIYTSAQSGLKPGSSGFCTVVCTAGMDQRTAQRLEGLSGYRHPFAVNDPRNPVNYQHITMRIGAANTHVLSRVCDAGPDHTGRTNKLAHHLAFTQPPSPSGPARLLDAGGVFVDKWDGQTSQRPSRSLPAAPLENTTLTAWASLTGDGGWAGHIAEQLIGTEQPVYVLFAPGTDTLALLKEVIDVVPPNRRWGITFSTYYTNAIAGAQCQLRFVLHGTQDATKLRNDARATIVDLTANLPAATGGDLVDLARKGLITYATPAAQKSAPQIEQALDLDDVVDDWEEPDLDESPSAKVANTASSRPDVAPPRQQAPNLFGAHRSQKDRKLAAAGKRSGRGWIVGLVFGILLLIGGVGTGIWFLVLRGGTDVGGQKQLAESEKNRKEAVAVEKKVGEENATREAPITPSMNERPKEELPPTEAVVKVDPPPEPEAEVLPQKKTTDIFGSPLKKEAKLSDPVVRVIPWDDQIGGVRIPVVYEPPLELILHHHDVKYEVKATPGGDGWEVIGGVEPFKSRVAKIVWEDDGQLFLKRFGKEEAIPLAVCQLVSGDRCGFVIFQRPELRQPIPFSQIVGRVTEKHPSVSEHISKRRLDNTATQRVQVKDKTGAVVQMQNCELGDQNARSRSACDKKKNLSKPTEFYFDDGAEGAEHRHVFRLIHDKSGSRVDYLLEFAQRKGLRPMARTPPVSQSGINWGKWAGWLTERLDGIRESHSKREWEKVDHAASDRCRSESHKLTKIIKETEQALLELHKQLQLDVRRQGNEAKINAFNKLEPDQAIFDQMPQSEQFSQIRDSLGKWANLKSLSEQILEQSAAAAKSRERLAKHEMHFSVFLEIKETVELPNRPKRYRLQVPVIEFSNRKNKDELNWKDILSVTDEDTQPETAQSSPVGGALRVRKADTEFIAP